MFIFASVTADLGLPDGLLSALCFVESSHKINAINRNDGVGHSLGICQIKLSTAKMLGYKGTAEKLHKNPKVNAYWAGRYLKRQINRYDDVNLGIAAYNAGTVRLNDRGEIMNRKYLVKVLKRWRTTHETP